MQEAEQTITQTSWFFEALGEIGQFTARLVRNFFKVALIGFGFASVLGIAVYLGSAGGPAWRSAVSCSATVVICAVVTIASAANLAVVLSLAQTVRAKGLAKRVLDGLFAELLGITDKNPQGDYDQTQKLHGMPIEELRGKLKTAGNHMLAHPIATFLPGFVRWLMRKAERLLIWATVRVVIAYATANAGEDRKVDLLALRGNLTAMVDDLVTRRITQSAIRLAFVAALIVTAAAWVIVTGLNRLAPL